MQSSKRPKYIIIEGIDGAGKQTQAAILKDYLISRGKKVIVQSFPDYPSQGCGPIKMYLNGELSKTAEEVDAYQSSVLFAVDRFCTMKKMLNSIDNETIVIFDRYVSSNLLHQGGKIKDEKELEKYIKWEEDFEFNVMKIPKPDIIFFLKVSPEVSVENRKNRSDNKSGTVKDIHESDNEHLIHAYNTGIKIAKMLNWHIINCANDETKKMLDKEVIAKEIETKLNEVLGI